jgi:hypothetical protein
MSERPRIAWHYTSGVNLRAILRSGVLLPSAIGSERTGDLPAVWFSMRRDWDPAVGLAFEMPESLRAEAKAAVEEHLAGGRNVLEWWAAVGPTLTLDEIGGMARVGVAPEAAPYSWQDFVRLGGIEPPRAAAREWADRSAGSNPDDWRVSLVPVPSARWIAVEWRSGMRPGERWETVARVP